MVGSVTRVIDSVEVIGSSNTKKVTISNEKKLYVIPLLSKRNKRDALTSWFTIICLKKMPQILIKMKGFFSMSTIPFE